MTPLIKMFAQIYFSKPGFMVTKVTGRDDNKTEFYHRLKITITIYQHTELLQRVFHREFPLGQPI